MAIEPGEYEGGSLLDYVDAAVDGMKADLEPGDLAIIGVVRKSAMAWDTAVADGKMNSAMAYLAYVSNGIEKLGGSALARKQLGKKAEKPKSSLAAVRELHGAQDKKPAARKPRASRAKGA
jgi:hypothetical protein